MRRCRDSHAFTLIEMVLVIVIGGILATVVLRGVGKVSEAAKVERTKQELQALDWAIVGNPQLQNNGARSDFGYVGDIGAMPPNLDALVSNPGYATWRGPYVHSEFASLADDYQRDAWGAPYKYRGVEIVSTGSGSEIVRRMGNSVSDFTLNSVSGMITDNENRPPGVDNRDSIVVRLAHPDGAGATVVRVTRPDAGGYFSIDSVPVGNHDLQILYLPGGDTLSRFLSVLPHSDGYSVNRLPISFPAP